MSPRDRASAGRATFITALCSLPVAVVSAWIIHRNPVAREGSITDRPIQVAGDNYASSRACRSCHPDEYATWHDSYHRTMTQVATPATVVPSFDNALVENVYGSDLRLERLDAELYATFDDPDSSERAGARSRIRRKVVMITGSHHQQVYWYATGQNRLVGQLPAIYLLAEKRWIPRRAAVVHPPTDPLFSETGHWNSTCLACHATHGKPEFDTPFGSKPIETQVIRTTTAELGISCEACHGPSELHVRLNGNPWRRYWFHLTREADKTTVLPTRLTPRLSSQVCGQCHSVWEFYDQRGERESNSAGLPYRPGDDLAATRFVAQPTRNTSTETMQTLLAEDKGFIRDSFWSDGMVRVTGREYNGLIESPCFRKATDDRRTLSCFSCHIMHKQRDDPRDNESWADGQVATRMDGNDACLQCHESMRARVSAHTNHGPQSSGSSCYNCHMPYTSYGLLKTIRSHQVSSPSVATTVATGRPNACNLCHLDQTLAWTSDHLERWYGTPRTALADDDRSIAASLLWLLRGDAAERVITAQAFGWKPAQNASGSGWMPVYLAQLLDDPYEAIRFVAYRSLAGLPGYDGLAYDFVAPARQRFNAQLRTIDIWRSRQSSDRRTESQLLFNPDGSLRGDIVKRLLQARDHKRVLLRE
ncbi:MAG TPA: ammonia-forming cytochrome c nitrite reductase subunit c552 [Vicinamibacterales bacterium]|nr:ammonia-forming cytochrome c nitrite reductase subunit c552 [Vicinamibacterales bacterium]